MSTFFLFTEKVKKSCLLKNLVSCTLYRQQILVNTLILVRLIKTTVLDEMCAALGIDHVLSGHLDYC